MDNLKFVDDEDIPLIEEDYDDDSQYDTSDISRIDETLFTKDTEQPATMVRL